MARYSYELKKKIVEEYLRGKISHQALVMKYRVEKFILRLWISNCKSYGNEGLMRFRNNRACSVEFKLEAVIRCEASEYSYRQLALELGLTNPSMTVNRRRQYREKDIGGLLPHKRGGPVTGKDDHDQPPKTVEKSESIDASTHEVLENHIKGLEAENRRLTIQKAFWGQLRSLEKEEVMNKRRRLSPNSKSNSN